MNINELVIENFLVIEKARVELANRGLILVQGVNKDDTSAKSNGAGKSSIVDAICWALYGVTARDVTADEVVHDKVGKNCMVSLELQEGSDVYRIERYRKHSVNKNQTIVLKKAATPGEAAIVLTKGTEKETQEVINNIIGCSLEVFQASVYAGQEKMPNLPAMTDKQLKLMIEEAAGIEVLAKAHQKARNKLNVVSTTVGILSPKLSALIDTELRIECDMKENQKQLTEYENERREKAKAELSGIASLQARIAGFQRVIDEVAFDRIEASLAEVNAKLGAQQSDQDKYEALLKDVRAASNVTVRARAQAETLKSKLDDAKKSLATLDNTVGTPCVECGKEYHEEDLASVRLVRQNVINTIESSFRPALVALKEAIESEKKHADIANRFKDTLVDVSALAAEGARLQSRILDATGAKTSITLLNQKIEAIKNTAKMHLSSANPYVKSAEMCKARAIANTTEIAETKAKLEKAQTDLELMESAVKVFGPAGVRAHILDTVTPFLNDRTSHYLSALSDGNITAVWNTLSKNAKGELKEKFNIEVINSHGGASFKAQSGGEKRKVRLACAMALQDMVASRASKPINIFAADEIDDALDESGLERLMTILNEKAKERGTVLVVSHSDLKDWIDEVITVTKTGKMGRLTGATCV